MTSELEKVAEDSARGGFFLVSGAALATAIMAVATILIGRVLGPELYGLYTLTLVVPQLLFLFTDLGVNLGVTKFVANFNIKAEISRIRRMIKYALLLRTIVGFILFAINYIIADWLASVVLQRPELTFYVRISSLSVLFQVVYTTSTSAFVGLDKSNYNAVTTNVQALAKTTISIALVLLGFGISGAVVGTTTSYLAGSIVGSILLILVLRQRVDRHSTSGVAEDLGLLMRYGMPLYVSILLTGSIPLYQNFWLARLATNADIGNYKEATNFATLMTVLSIPITTALLAAFSKLDSSASQKIKRFCKLANKYIALIVIPTTVFIIVFSRQIVDIVLGSKFQSAPSFLATSCLIFFLEILGYLTLTGFFNGLGQTMTTLSMNLIVLIVVVPLSPTLTTAYGVQGLIAAFLIANTAGTVYGFYVARRKYQIEFDNRSLFKIYLISALCAVPSILILNLTPLSHVLKFAIGGALYLVSYATLVPLTKIVTASELQKVIRITQKTRLLSFIAEPVLRYQERILRR